MYFLALTCEASEKEIQSFIRNWLYIQKHDHANVVAIHMRDQHHENHMLGYVQKDHGMAHYGFWQSGFTEDEILEARKTYTA